MKRMISCLVAVCILAALCGCTGGLSNTDGTTTTTTTTSTATGTKPTLASKAEFPVTVEITESIRVRKGPGIQFEAIGGSAKGDTWTATAREGDWFKIDSKDGAVGYVNAQYVSVTK